VNGCYVVRVLYADGTLTYLATAITVLGLIVLLEKRVTAAIRAGKVLLTVLGLKKTLKVVN
jgi:hypothetical protein